MFKGRYVFSFVLIQFMFNLKSPSENCLAHKHINSYYFSANRLWRGGPSSLAYFVKQLSIKLKLEERSEVQDKNWTCCFSYLNIFLTLLTAALRRHSPNAPTMSLKVFNIINCPSKNRQSLSLMFMWPPLRTQ